MPVPVPVPVLRPLLAPVLVVVCACVAAGGIAPATGAEAGEADRRAGTIYVCTAGGHTEYSDRPCAPAAAMVELPARGIGRAGSAAAGDAPASAAVAPRPAAPAPRRSSSSARAPRDWVPGGINGMPPAESARCRSLRRSLERLDSRMRAGYTAPQGESLRERRRALRAAQHAARCR